MKTHLLSTGIHGSSSRVDNHGSKEKKTKRDVYFITWLLPYLPIPCHRLSMISVSILNSFINVIIVYIIFKKGAAVNGGLHVRIRTRDPTPSTHAG